MNARTRRIAATLLATAAAASPTRAGTPPCHCPGDADGDGLVAVGDLVDLIATWGDCSLPCPPSCPADFDANCVVDIQDLVTLLSSWGMCELEEFPDPFPSLPTATDLGTVTNAPIDYCEFIGAGDTDVYRFEVTETRVVHVALTDRVDGINARIVADLDDNTIIDGADVLEQINAGGANDIVLSEDLVPGTYYIVLDANGGAFTAYALRVSSTPLPSLPDDPGQTLLDDPHELGTLDGTALELHEVVGGFDGFDVYQFTLTEARAVHVGMYDRTEGVNYRIVANFDGDGTVDDDESLEVADSTGNADLDLFEDLAPATYHIVVRGRNADHSTRYRMIVQSPALDITPEQEPGRTMIDDPYHLGTLDDATIEEHEVVGGFDDFDVYSFTLTEARAVHVGLYDRTEGVNYRIVANYDGDGIVDGIESLEVTETTGAADLDLSEDLAPETYYIVIRGRNSDHSTRYRLVIQSTVLSITPGQEPGDTLDDGYPLGTVDDGAIEEQEVVGGFDAHDVYSFVVAAPRTVFVSATDRTEGARLFIVEDLNGNGLFDGNESIAATESTGPADLTLVEDLAPGTYFIVIEGRNADHSTRYTLGVM